MLLFFQARKLYNYLQKFLLTAELLRLFSQSARDITGAPKEANLLSTAASFAKGLKGENIVCMYYTVPLKKVIICLINTPSKPKVDMRLTNRDTGSEAVGSTRQNQNRVLPVDRRIRVP